jgi:Family of unknown function (DUF6159)
MNQFKRGFALAGQSWRTLRSHRSLLLFPILGTALALVVVGPPALAGAYLADRGDTVPAALLGVLAVYLICFVSAFVGVGLAGAADAALVGGAWSVISLLAVPAIALEGAGPVTAIKRSAVLFKEHWGGRVTGMAAIGLGVFLLVMLPAILLGVAAAALLSNSDGAAVDGGAVLIAVAVVVFCAGVVLSNALRQVFAVALYRYTTSGEVAQGFDPTDLEQAIRVRGRRVPSPAVS